MEKAKCWAHLRRDSPDLTKERPPPDAGRLRFHQQLGQLFLYPNAAVQARLITRYRSVARGIGRTRHRYDWPMSTPTDPALGDQGAPSTEKESTEEEELIFPFRKSL